MTFFDWWCPFHLITGKKPARARPHWARFGIAKPALDVRGLVWILSVLKSSAKYF
jgi:hypothetical protein